MTGSTTTGPVDTLSSDRLYELLPVLYRLEDIEQGHPLQALLRAINEQAEILRQNVDRLWDDFFIETCQEWVIPYIGDLVANNALNDTGARQRVDVAKTIYYRRRKGTMPMLEELARDVTGWGAHAVEFFELLGWTQNLNHLRFQAGWPDIRDIDLMDRIDGPFDAVSHTVDIKPPNTLDGWHNIKNIGFFLYRLTSYPLQGTVLTDGAGAEIVIRPQPRAAGAPNHFHFSSLGAPMPLFNHWRREGDEAALATEPFVPGPIRPIAFMRDLDRLVLDPTAQLVYYGAAGLAGANLDECDISTAGVPSGGSLAVFEDGQEVPAQRVLCKDLSAWDEPSAGSATVFVDVALGRFTVAADAPVDDLSVEYHAGFAGDVGGGPYDRRRDSHTGGDADKYRGWGPDTVADPEALGAILTVAADTADHTTITDALDEWRSSPTITPIVIHIEDDRTYVENLEIDLADATRVVIQAANERRPTVVGTVSVSGGDDEARLVIDGLVIEGNIVVEDELAELRLLNTTVVPGRSLDLDGNPPEPALPAIEIGVDADEAELILDACIVGPLRLPYEFRGVTAYRSIIDGVDGAAIARIDTDDETAGPVELWQVTVFGDVFARSMPMASEVIFTQPVQVERTQAGCVRFSFVEPGSATPRRYRCQPDMALDDETFTPAERAALEAALKPSHTSVHFHDPGYSQLSFKCPVEITTGAEDQSEMGVWAWLRNPQRVANLRIRLDEYLPFGLEPALIYVT
jgi:hypothetical protein